MVRLTFVKSLNDSLVLIDIWDVLVWCVTPVPIWVWLRVFVVWGWGKIWLQLSCVTIFTCLTVCGLRVEGLGGCDMVVGEPYCDQSMIQ